MSGSRPTPFPMDPTWMKEFNAATGDPDKKVQAKLAKEMKISYRSGVGELLSQSNHCPHEHHYHGLRHALKYLYVTKDDGIYFWRTTPRPEFKEGPLPPVHSNKQNLLMTDDCPEYDANILHVYADSERATCPKT